MNRKGANERNRELTRHDAVQCGARNRCGHMTLIEVHGERRHGAHRVPPDKTAAWKKRARTSCRSDSETVQKSTTSIVHGTCPLFDILEILGGLQTQRQVKRW
jgi:hypothetical protein